MQSKSHHALSETLASLALRSVHSHKCVIVVYDGVYNFFFCLSPRRFVSEVVMFAFMFSSPFSLLLAARPRVVNRQ